MNKLVVLYICGTNEQHIDVRAVELYIYPS